MQVQFCPVPDEVRFAEFKPPTETSAPEESSKSSNWLGWLLLLAGIGVGGYFILAKIHERQKARQSDRRKTANNYISKATGSGEGSK